MCSYNKSVVFSIAELESHRDRVSRHSQGLMASVNEQKTSTQKLATQQELEVRIRTTVHIGILYKWRLNNAITYYDSITVVREICHRSYDPRVKTGFC